ncbi:hypothetical protein GCM10009850_116830 [Nonomuraea monospora]|uniref:Uncharacterized protein n=1 Tax=Nonomuraea monospora TaxID=568818 RepID=A0ABN3D313_9ACTN
MPVHALVGHLVLITAPLTALLAVVYAWRPAARRGMRTPLAMAAVLNLALATWAEGAGSALYDTLQTSARNAGGELPAAALDHAHQGDALTVASFVLLVTVLTVVWRTLAPGRERKASGVIASCVLAVAAAAVCWYAGAALIEGLNAVWAQHPGWLP